MYYAWQELRLRFACKTQAFCSCGLTRRHTQQRASPSLPDRRVVIDDKGMAWKPSEGRRKEREREREGSRTRQSSEPFLGKSQGLNDPDFEVLRDMWIISNLGAEHFLWVGGVHADGCIYGPFMQAPMSSGRVAARLRRDRAQGDR